jgi:hypothetical protein
LVIDQARNLGGGNQRAGDGAESGEGVEFHEDFLGAQLVREIYYKQLVKVGENVGFD